jgi:hypothetical protein
VTFAHEHDRIADGLRRFADALEPVDDRGWKVAIRNGTTVALSARVEGKWLLLDAPLRHAGVSRRDLLVLNGRLEGAAKVARPPSGGEPRLRAELPVPGDEEIDFVPALAATFLGFRTALGWLHGARDEQRAMTEGQAMPIDSVALQRLCEGSGWAWSERSGARVAVALETEHGAPHAELAHEPDGDLRVHVSVGAETLLPAPRADDPGTAEATERFLLAACGAVRMARAALDEGGRARFEVRLAADAASRQLEHALSALSVAWGLCARELLALQDPELARAFSKGCSGGDADRESRTEEVVPTRE